jgi:ketosteroid isomerase-like protein
MSESHLDKIRLYLKSIEIGNSAVLRELFSPSATCEQLPNRIYPQGSRADVTKMDEAFAKGRKLLSTQSYEIKNHVVEGNSVALEVLWTGKLSIAFGNLPAGHEMRAHSAMFFQFENGKIVSQRNYDCFEAW